MSGDIEAQTTRETDAAPAGTPAESSSPSPRAASSLLEGGIARTVWRLALPTWAAFVFLNLMSIVDMFFVGKLGPSAVAALAMSGTMFGIIIMLALGLETGITALVANAIGRADPRRAGQVTGQGLVMAALLAIPLAALGIPLAPAIIRALGGKPQVITEGAAYLRIVSGGGLTILVMISMSGAFRGAGDPTTPLKAMIAANLLNAVLDPILIFGLLGLPALGVAGSAWATVTGRVLGVFMLMGALLSARNTSVPLHLRDLRPRLSVMLRIGRIGIFASGRVLLRNIGMLLLMRLTAVFGTAAVAAYGIGLRLQMLVLGPGKGFGTAAAAMVGQNLGADQPRRAARSGWVAAAMATVVGVLFTVLFWADPRLLIQLFNKDAQVIEAGGSLLRWFSASFPLLVMAIVLSEAMNGAGDSLRPMVITGLSLLVIGVPTAYLLSSTWDSVTGIWVALLASNLLMGLLSAVEFRQGRWKAAGSPVPAVSGFVDSQAQGAGQ